MQPKQQRDLEFGDYLAIAKRRALWIVIPTLVVALVAIAVSFLLPARYTSRALIIIEQQEVPDKFVPSIINQNMDVRLATMTETVLSRSRLQPLIERFGLYSRQNLTIDEKLEKLRKDITVSPAKSTLGRDSTAPGFIIAVDASEPSAAQHVCAEISSMFLSENLNTRQQSAEGTTQFLQGQLEDAKRNLDQQDAALAAFQKQYLGQLPGQEQNNMTALTTLNSRLDASTQALDRLEQEKTFAEALLAQQTATLEAAQGGDVPPAQRLHAEIEQLEAQLSSLSARYTPDHPDVVKARRELETLKKSLAEDPTPAATPGPGKKAVETPSVQQLRAQLRSIQAGIASQKAEQDRIQQQIKLYQSRIQLSPEVEERHRQLTRDYETAQRFYSDLLTKRDQSAMSTDMERRQIGEQFRLMDPPNLPTKPSFPDRLLFAIGGLAGGLFVGGGLAALSEYRDKTLRNEHDVLYFTKLETLAIIPVIASAMPAEPKRRFLHRRTPPSPVPDAPGLGLAPSTGQQPAASPGAVQVLSGAAGRT
jgi:polysaccharide chain length determinant protein (PEP-CTERM system associated)